MANLVLVDSNFFITRATRGEDPFVELVRWSEQYEFATCGVIMLEVLRGRLEPAMKNKFSQRFGVMVYIPTHNRVWERATALAWALDRRGVKLSLSDLVIAAHALEAGASVLTADRQFNDVPGLTVLDQLR